jgi:glycerol uptake facilitator protein
LFFLPHWKGTESKEAKLAVFALGPAIRDLPANAFSEIIGTIVLVIGIAAIVSKVVAPAGLAPGVAPWMVGMLVWAIGLPLGGTTGYAINPGS